MNNSEFTLDQLDLRLEELDGKRAATERALAAATAAYKKCRQMRGADAHKRSWYFEEKMKSHQAILERVGRETEELQAERAQRDAPNA